MSKIYLSSEEMFQVLERDRANQGPLRKALVRLTVAWKKVRSIPSRVLNAWDRSRRGYGHRDLWNLDVHVAQVLSRALWEMSFDIYSYPGDGEWTFDSWIRFLRELSADLANYASDPVVYYYEGRDAMRRFADNLGSMWI